MSKGMKIMMRRPTEMADQSYWELPDSEMAAEEPLWKGNKPSLNVDDSQIVWAVVEPLVVRPEFIPGLCV